ncbi:DAK2 domain-containing protein [Actinoplanes sp. NPDC051343]|uniref:DAK2 domain-containing protein n=1 Tax=Actinoplanes sp. NPDC051343 TaxID=3363906 RepID=UPI0037B0FFB8
MLQTLDAAAVHRWCGGGLEALRAHQHEIDELNVYPVPDGDTGTNLVLTLAAAQEALDRYLAEHAEARAGEVLTGDVVDPAEVPTTTLGRAMRRMARGALLGARGNSGVIVSQILRGMADTFATSVAVRGGELARALRTATEAAYGAVARPVEGTVLSVVAAAAEGAGRIKSDDLLAVARAAAVSAREALARTPQQLPALARAGVVDAGGRGLCLLLDALVEALGPRDPAEAVDTGDPALVEAGDLAVVGAVGRRDSAPAAALEPGCLRASPGESLTQRAARAFHGGEADSRADRGEGEFGYEVQYLLDATDDAVGRLRPALDALGDSLVVVGTGDGDPPTWNVHVHVPAESIGPAVEAGIAAGRPYQIKVSPLDERIAEEDAAGAADQRGAVVVAAGDGLTALFEAEGAVVVGRNPSTAEMLAAVTATDARSVVLLPNDAATHAVATAAAREAERSGLRVSVVPTRSPVQALAALAVRDGSRAFADDVIAMAEAAGACRYGEVCTAQRAAFTVAGPCQEGDLLGLVDGEVHVIGTDLEDVSRRLLDRMLGGGGELTTLVLGADAPDRLDEVLRGHVTQTWPFVELQSYAGGQPRYHLLVGVE